MTIFDVSTLTLLVLVVFIALALGAAVGWIIYVLRAARLPAATKLVDVEERYAVAQEALQRKEQELREIDQRIADRDRQAAEAGALRELIDDLNAQYASLEDAKKDIKATLDEAGDAAARLATVKQELFAAESRLEQVNRELDPERIKRLQDAQHEAERERDRIRAELDPLKAEAEAAHRVIAEARATTANVEAMKQEAKRLDAECDRLSEEEVDLQEKVQAERDALTPLRVERDMLRAEQLRLSAEAQQLETRVASLRHDLKDALAKIQPTAAGQAPVGPVTPEQRKALLSDLLVQPTCLAFPASLRPLATMTETEAIFSVQQHLQDSGLRFSNRVQRAFHTALKINDTAQITVLAGVSGTGKSLLPRRYAEAMGIHFMQVAVEPRWDSPQDLLGFYNYVEGKYRATDLARLMAAMDPWQSFGADAPNSHDHLAMVLLDEMNLARVEYYFSEFLSRLEVRPDYGNTWPQRDACKDSLIPVDIRGLENPPSLFPGHNMLFVGTMNDDESTQSLSDKVLDRGNVMQFPAPSSFPQQTQGAAGATADALRFKQWRKWIRPTNTLQGAEENEVGQVISKLAEIMSGFGRPFGFRLNQSIRHYVANYPTEGTGGTIAQALVDQIEFRIMPKLRGIEIDNHAHQFEDLETLIGSRLNDPALSTSLRDLREKQAQGSGQFVWRGFEREA
ncbi:AAA family ATPase [Roseinatronobacter sp.]|uniref:AAA family ATPase n=1 Tax=Roseinatronobacter sp. TaxID=1945755 RepID=UPI0025CFAE7F|nr:AAA family ATPase [Roseibaca sp.]